MGITAAVAGASGYAGGELLRLLVSHPQLQIGPLAAGSAAGSRVTDLHPHLPMLSGMSFQTTDPDLLGEADVVFLALPHGESAAIAGRLRDGVKVVDLGADHRLADPAEWERFYGGAHAGTWVYGMPELRGARAEISAASRVAAPGCYPTAVTLALTPLLADVLVSPDDLVVVASSGTSGAGRAAKANLLGSEVMGDLSAYKVGRHQHTPEIRQSLARAAGRSVGLSFTPVLAPMPRGILATCTAVVAAGVTEQDLRECLLSAYADEPFVHVLAAGVQPHTAATVGSNSCHLQVVLDEDAGRAVVVSAIDNLGKGAAGQALQCANLMLGLDETLGLPIAGVAP